MTRPVLTLYLLMAAVLFFGCSRENIVIEPAPYQGNVDARLMPYFESFALEAAARGVEVDFNSFPISGRIISIQEDDIAGTCHYNHEDPNLVTIDLEYWNASSSLRREMVVFHELGHCYLGLGHTETAFDNGICSSIMNSGTSGCYVAYSPQNRDYYLDELFGDR